MKNCIWLHICMIKEIQEPPPCSKMMWDLQASRRSESDKLDEGRLFTCNYDTVEIQNANSKPPRKLETTNPLQSPPKRLFKSGMSCVVHGIFINLASQMRDVSILQDQFWGAKTRTNLMIIKAKDAMSRCTSYNDISVVDPSTRTRVVKKSPRTP